MRSSKNPKRKHDTRYRGRMAQWRNGTTVHGKKVSGIRHQAWGKLQSEGYREPGRMGEWGKVEVEVEVEEEH